MLQGRNSWFSQDKQQARALAVRIANHAAAGAHGEDVILDFSGETDSSSTESIADESEPVRTGSGISESQTPVRSVHTPEFEVEANIEIDIEV